MIVMKFGGSSVESASAIRRLAAIVETHLLRNPVVVVSAMGKTTNRLLNLAQEAARAHTFFVTRGLDELRDHHFDVAAEVSSGEARDRLDTMLQRHFRDLHVLLADIAEEGRELTPAVLDEIASYGERMSSQVICAALESAGVPSVHIDAREVILTDNHYTQAAPLYWETYAKLRRRPEFGSGRVAVMGGFIGSCPDGTTTTLGRGGSDLSAAIVGAGISAREIQIWTDVDGMLTGDPRVAGDYHRVRSISYEEATEMARGGAKVLHPDSVMPAVRQRIPIVIRNSRNPENEGTRIVASATGSGMVKSIACRQDVMILEIQPERASDGSPWEEAIEQLSARNGVSPEWIGQQGNAAVVAVRGEGGEESIRFAGCMKIRVHPHSAVLTLVGDRLVCAQGLWSRTRGALKQVPAMVMNAPHSEHAIVIVVPQADLCRSMQLLHNEFFAEPDPSIFTPCPSAAASRVEDSGVLAAASGTPARQKLRLALELGR